MCSNQSLRCKVSTISIGCICFYILSIVGQVFLITSAWVRQQFGHDEYRTFQIILISTMVLCGIGLLTCILLLIGVCKKHRLLVMPFMIFTECFLFIIIVVDLICDILYPLYGLVLLFFIPPVVYTVVRVRQFYNAIETSKNCETEATEKNQQNQPAV